ncbi:hypothetical protein B0T21DRAFT_351246 [Apiosordaria backusii]|uniref:Rhodopsin domain-containing protein n=1 Tax=Apiosordaria backusii TaxID=314023 RepID=A0AA40E3J7_9PEZI|nr:hypothetical protein B0T21DRAFT_351246 [Apiosordaria backusii]
MSAPTPTDAPPPPPPDGLPPGILVTEKAAHLAQTFIAVTSILMALCLITFFTRIYQRVFPVYKMGLDDWFIIAGFILAIADWSLLFPLMVPRPGYIPFSRGTEAGKHSWLAIPVWGLAMTCIKISIALTLLRIRGSERRWRIFLYTIIVILSIYGIGNTIFCLAIACQPLQAAWDVFTPGGKCVPVQIMKAISDLGSGINITTDLLLSLTPITFLRKLNRPLRERVFVCMLMGMGLLASVSSIVKTVIIKDWGDPTAAVDDWWAMGVSICTWTALEQLLGVLAACVPAMKGVFQRCLGGLGVDITGTGTGRSGVDGDRVRSGTFESLGSSGGGNGNNRFSSVRQVGVVKDDEHGTVAVVEYDEEVGIDLPEIRRQASTVKSMDGSDGRGELERGNSRGSEGEKFPAHAL